MTAENPAMNIDMSVNVLSMAYWPSYPQFEINVPSDMGLYQEVSF